MSKYPKTLGEVEVEDDLGGCVVYFHDTNVYVDIILTMVRLGGLLYVVHSSPSQGLRLGDTDRTP